MILQSLYNAGLIQFGHFEDGQGIQQVKYSLEFLPSYPKLILDIANAITVDTSGSQFDYLLASCDAISLGTIIGQLMQHPTVFENNSGLTPANRIVGAYDTGHPTILITNIVSNRLHQLISDASKVGLEVQQIVSIVEGDTSLPYLTRTLIGKLEINEFRETMMS